MPERSRYSFDIERLKRLQVEAETMDSWERIDWVDECYQSEVADAWFLVKDGWVAPNIFSSTDWIKEQEERYRNHEKTPTLLSEMAAEAVDCGLHPPKPRDTPTPNWDFGNEGLEGMLRLEAAWERTCKEDIDNSLLNSTSLRALENSIPKDRYSTTVEAFVGAIENGRIPTPELLLSIAKSFLLYFEADGELTLEEVFFGAPKRRSGNYANQALKENQFLIFHDTVVRERAFSDLDVAPRRSLESIAESFFESMGINQETEANESELPSEDIDSFLRGYRRWRTKQKGLPDK